jgi:phage terminase large subunit-like protein
MRSTRPTSSTSPGEPASSVSNPYSQRRKSFEGTAQDCIWLDEECPYDVYLECLTRLLTTRGIIWSTFTPLQGLTEVVLRFLPAGRL